MTDTEISYPPARVHIVADDTRRPQRPRKPLRTRFGTETVDDSNPVRPLLPDAPERDCARVQVTGGDVYLCDSEAKARQAAGAGTGAGTGASTQASGSQTGPAAGTDIAEITGLAAGEYVITATVSETGTTAAADNNNNMGLCQNSTLIQQLMYNHSTTIQSASIPMTVTVAAGDTISVQAIGAATSTGVYTAQIVATPARTTQAAAGEDAPAAASELGTVLPSANTAPWELRGTQAVWIAQATSGDTCVVSYTADYET